MNQKKHYRFVSDPGHGWLGVPNKDVKALGLSGELSRCSYYDKKTDTVWLEEDCDAALFMNRAKDVGWEVTFSQESVNEEAFIRKLSRT